MPQILLAWFLNLFKKEKKSIGNKYGFVHLLFTALVANWQGQDWFVAEMPLRENFSQIKKRKIKIEPHKSETPSVSEPEKLVEVSGSPSPHPSGRDEQGTIGDAAAAWIKEEKDPLIFQTKNKPRFPHISSEESKASNSSALSFPQKFCNWLKVTKFR